MEFNYCYKCMEQMPAGQKICPSCGHDNSVPSSVRECLPEGSILNGKYLVGQLLGRGGFGITYIAIELNLNVKVAIKEYFPADVCNRSGSSRKVEVSNQQVGEEGFQKGIAAFQKEAKALALYDTPSIAHVREFFRENNTAYIVMDYIDGTDLSKELSNCGGRMPWERVKTLMLPLIQALNSLHEKGLIHRDIKPDNLKIIRDEESGTERLVLLDFGAARNVVSADQTNTYTQILTPGYAPFEQYQVHTHLGPFSDIYALSATMYTAISGETPPTAPDRIMDDPLQPFSSFGLDVPENLEKAIFHGMAVNYKDRPQTMADLYREITESPVRTAVQTGSESKTAKSHDRSGSAAELSSSEGKTKSSKRKIPLLWIFLCLLLAAIPAYLLFNRPQGSEMNAADTQPETTETTVPALKETKTEEITALAETSAEPFQTENASSQEGFTDDMSITPTAAHEMSGTADVSETSEEIIVRIPPEIEAIPIDALQPTFTAVPTDTPQPTVTTAPTKTPQPTAEPLKLNVGDNFSFGSYEQDENNGAEPIDWQVLAVEEGRALLISKYSLEVRSYHGDFSPITWENSDMRNWLNSEFLDEAFTSEEQTLILEVTNSNPDNPDWGTEGGNDTRDRLFLLSIDEQEKYFENDEARTCRLTYQAAKKSGMTYLLDPENFGQSYGWWLRTPSWLSTHLAEIINSQGSHMPAFGNGVPLPYGVRPAFWLNLTGKSVDTPGTGITPDPVDTPQPFTALKNVETGDRFTFGSYEQDEKAGADPIVWRVLTVNNGQALVISEYGLESKSYKVGTDRNVTWEASDLRSWLNGDFYITAFNAGERQMIREVRNSNPDNPIYRSEGGSDTLDRVFLLSIDEANQYFKDSSGRQCRPTRHAEQGGAAVNSRSGYSRWWLRSPGYGWEPIGLATDSYDINSDCAAVVYDTGNVLDLGYNYEATGIVVRPALWLVLPEETAAAEGAEEPPVKPESETPAQPPAEPLKLNAGDVFTFGSYQQNRNSGTAPIEWQVLAAENGQALLISKYGLDTKQYHNESENVTWETSSLRNWLNGTFYNSAFSPEEKASIILKTNRNDSNPKYGTNGGKDTQDRIFLLSIEEANRYFSSDSTRQLKSTALAKANGAEVNADTGNSRWWLRSPGRSGNNAAYVTNSGTVRLDGMNVISETDVLRPALWLSLTAEVPSQGN